MVCLCVFSMQANSLHLTSRDIWLVCFPLTMSTLGCVTKQMFTDFSMAFSLVFCPYQVVVSLKAYKLDTKKKTIFAKSTKGKTSIQLNISNNWQTWCFLSGTYRKNLKLNSHAEKEVSFPPKNCWRISIVVYSSEIQQRMLSFVVAMFSSLFSLCKIPTQIKRERSCASLVHFAFNSYCALL